MIRPVVKYGAPVLESATEPVVDFDDALRALVDDMFETMYDAKGVGLAAPQIGLRKRLAVIDVGWSNGTGERIVLINPTIVAREGDQLEREGCLSVPGFREMVRRAAKVTVRAQDAEGAWFERAGEGLLARAFEHETDHLDKTLYLAHLGPLARGMIQKKVQKLVRAGKW